MSRVYKAPQIHISQIQNEVYIFKQYYKKEEKNKEGNQIEWFSQSDFQSFMWEQNI